MFREEYVIERLYKDDIWLPAERGFKTLKEAIDFIDDNTHTYRIMKELAAVSTWEVYRSREI